MGVSIREGSQTVKLLLACGIPKRKLNLLPINKNIVDVIFEHRRLIDLREVASGENIQ